jgi:polyphosphate kinase
VVPGLLDNIRVRSILGRFLEHSRIIRFGHGDEGKPLFLIGSADWMPRNLDRRIEVLVPVSHPKHQAWLDHVYEIQFADDIVRWEMDGEGSWQRRGPEMFTDGDSQERFYHWVADRQKR